MFMKFARFALVAVFAFLALAPSAFAKAPASCMGLTGQALQVCNEQRAAEQAAQIAATKRQLAALEVQCSQVCTDAPAASAPNTASGPSRTYLVLDAYGKRLDELEGLVRDGVVSDAELEIELRVINEEITTISATLDDHERRIKALEDAEPTITAPPTLIEGPAGADGANGRNGIDGRPAEITVLAGVAGLYSSEWNIVGGEVNFRVGGRPTQNLRLGGYGNGFIAGANDLGFGAGGYVGYDVRWARPSLMAGWREVGLDISTEGARRVFQGPEVMSEIEFDLAGCWVVSARMGVFIPGGQAAWSWGASTGFRF